MISKQTQNVTFDAKIIRHHVQTVRGLSCVVTFPVPVGTVIPLIHFSRADDLRKIHPFKTGKCARLDKGCLCRSLNAGHDATGLRAMLTQVASELPGINIGNRHDLAAH